jgi:hypothetical protein
LFLRNQFLKINWFSEVVVQKRIRGDSFKPKHKNMISVASRLRRPRQPMPEFIQQALDGKGLMDAYLDRPAYQQNDYISWIIRAKRPETRQKRLKQMLEELKGGGVYMKMAHPASRKR